MNTGVHFKMGKHLPKGAHGDNLQLRNAIKHYVYAWQSAAEHKAW